MSTQMAIAGIIFVTFLWGSWFQTVKHIESFPVHAFISMMYGISVVIVWLSIGLTGRSMIPEGVFHEIKNNVSLTVSVLVCGLVFGIAMQLHLTVVKRIGLILSTSVSATCAILGGTIVSAIFAGVPEGVSVSILFIASVLLILATITCQYAGICRDREKQKNEKEKSRMHDVLLLAFINLILMSSYPLANSIGLRSELNPEGVSALTNMGILVAGACLGSSFFTFLSFSRKKPERGSISMRKLFFLAAAAAFCHFGGNVLHAVFAPVVSVAVATVLGNSYHCWSYIWGILYGEFKGAGRRSYLFLLTGILLFVAGVVLLSFHTV